MDTIVDVVSGHAELSAVLITAACDVALIVALVAVVVIVSGVLKRILVGLIAFVAGSGSAEVVEGYLTFPGVVYHELSHALFAMLSGARVKSISFKRRPLPDGSGNVLGSVNFSPRGNRVARSFQLALTGIAPLVTGIVAMVLIAFAAYPQCTETWQRAVWAYLFFACCCTRA